MVELVLRDEVYAVVGAAMEVHSQLGPGFLEAVYQEALEVELSIRGIPFAAQHPIPVKYKGQLLDQYYVADFLCYEQVIIEIKAIKRLSEIEQAQIINYLKATGLKVGLLINFASHPKMDWKRFVV